MTYHITADLHITADSLDEAHELAAYAVAHSDVERERIEASGVRGSVRVDEVAE